MCKKNKLDIPDLMESLDVSDRNESLDISVQSVSITTDSNVFDLDVVNQLPSAMEDSRSFNAKFQPQIFVMTSSQYQGGKLPKRADSSKV